MRPVESAIFNTLELGRGVEAIDRECVEAARYRIGIYECVVFVDEQSLSSASCSRKVLYPLKMPLPFPTTLGTLLWQSRPSKLHNVCMQPLL